ncbi:MAG: hypothetical protein ABSH50_32065 [Bryobacteraceae bacterium]
MNCRLCGQTLGDYPADSSSLIGDGGWDRLTRHDVTIREYVWSTPRAHGGYLWFITESGQLCCYSPFDRRYSAQFAFGAGVGFSTLLIREFVRTHAGLRTPVVEPFAVALSPDALIGFGLVSRTRIELSPPGPGESFLNDTVQHFQGLDAADGNVWCLCDNPREGVSLVRADIPSGQCQKWPLGLQRAVGPSAVGGAIVAWSEDEMAVFDRGQVRKSQFPAGFSPFMGTATTPSLRGGLGQSPAVVCRTEIYVPGSFNQKPAFANFHLVNGAIAAAATLPLPGSGAYSQDKDACLLVATDGSLDRYEMATPKSLWKDPQLRSDRLPFSDGGFHAGFVQSAGGELLRMRGGRGSSDTNLPPAHKILDVHGFHMVGPALLCTYSSEGDAGIISWHA